MEAHQNFTKYTQKLVIPKKFELEVQKLTLICTVAPKNSETVPAVLTKGQLKELKKKEKATVGKKNELFELKNQANTNLLG